MANKHGDFIWYELLTPDVAVAADFYGAVIGWQARAFKGSVRGYHGLSIAGTDVGGMMPMPEAAERGGARPLWLGYIGVNDADAAAGEIVKAGGEQHMPPTDIPGVGRFAMLSDPQGAMFYVMRGSVEGTSTAFSPTRPGHCHWNELSTSDPEAALAFYRARFGWEKGDAMPMGERGVYQFITQHGERIGAMYRRTDNGPPPMWIFYFGVEDIDVATEAATKKGAAVHYGPAEVPGGSFIIIASDPQGAMFGLVGPRKS